MRFSRARNTGMAFACAAALAVACNVAGSAPASASPSLNNGGYYELQNADYAGPGSICLDANLNTLPANGTKVQIWGCNGWGNQTWIVHLQGGYMTLTNYDGGQCLDANSLTLPANNTKVQMWGCNGGDNQKWQFHNDMTAGTYQGGTITNGINTNECLDANSNTLPANETIVQIYQCNYGINQNWWFIPIS